MTEETAGPIFRANKRRKILRKRPESDNDDDNDATPTVTTSSHERGQSPTNRGNVGNEQDEDDTPKSDLSRMRKPKKHGIAFSSSDRPSSRPRNENQETAIVVAEPQSIQEQNSRFARPTGKAIVQDDKHMSAYIDSKLAEMRSAAATASNNTANEPSNPASENQQSAHPPPTTGPDTQILSPSNPTAPTPRPGNQQPPSNRRKKHPRAPSPSTLARASLIDQILRESNHTPHYTAPTTSRQPQTNSTSDLDPDAAAAAAFKAEFLAQAEQRNLSRRQPATNASAATATTSSGPKLGGSRAQRERMRAAEEAKGKK